MEAGQQFRLLEEFVALRTSHFGLEMVQVVALTHRGHLAVFTKREGRGTLMIQLPKEWVTSSSTAFMVYNSNNVYVI